MSGIHSQSMRSMRSHQTLVVSHQGVRGTDSCNSMLALESELGSARSFTRLKGLRDLKYTVTDCPGIIQSLLLSLQHVFAFLGKVSLIVALLTELLPLSERDTSAAISSILVASGVATLLSSLVGSRLPVILGPSFSHCVGLVGVVLFWKSAREESGAEQPAPFPEIMREIQGSIIATGLAQAILGYSGFFGLLSKFLLSPVSVAPQILVLGLSVFNGNALQGALKCPEVGVVQIALIVLCSQYFPLLAKLHRKLSWLGLSDTFSILVPTVITWLIALTITKSGGAFTSSAAKAYGSTDYGRFGQRIVEDTAWFSFPELCPYGTPVFSWPSIMIMSAATLSSSIESLGSYNAVARVSGAPMPEAGAINRGIGIEGVGGLLSAVLSGGLSLASSSSTTIGVLGITKVGSRRVVQMAALFLVFFGLVSKIGVALCCSLPLAMYFGTLCCTSGIVSSVGISIGQMAKLNSHRNIFVIGFALFNGLSVQNYFRIPQPTDLELAGTGENTSRSLLLETKSVLFNIFASVLFNPPCLTLALAVFLDATVPSGSCEERGLHVWNARSQSNTSKKAKERYEDCYFLPFGIGKRYFWWAFWL